MYLCDLIFFYLIFCVLTPLSAIFQLYHADQFLWWKKPEYPEGTTDHGQATGKLYHLQLRVECTLFCNLQSRARTNAVLVIGLYELLGNHNVHRSKHRRDPQPPSIIDKCVYHSDKEMVIIATRTTLERKPYNVYQQYPQEISDRRREQHLYVNPTKFTNNTHRKSVTDEENNSCT